MGTHKTRSAGDQVAHFFLLFVTTDINCFSGLLSSVYREGAEGAELETLEFRNSNCDIWLFRVFCEEVFTAEAQSSQRSENFKLELFTPRPRRLSLKNCG